MLWWREINSFMFINTTLEKTILFTLFTELLIKHLWTGGPQSSHCREKERRGKEEEQRREVSRKAGSKSCARRQRKMLKQGWGVCRGVGGVVTGKLGVKQDFLPSLCLSLFFFLLDKLPCPFVNQSKTNIAFHSLHLFEWTYRRSQNTRSKLKCN